MKAPNITQQEKNYYSSRMSLLSKVEGERIAEDFPMFTSRQELTRYLARYEIFKRILNVKGSIVECGVYRGAGLFLFAQLSAIFEPYALHREIIGFDTFEGFPALHQKDGDFGQVQDLSEANVRILEECIELYDLNRPISHIPKVKLVKGDATKTIPQFFDEHPYTVVALLHLDFDLYEPTKVAIETILPRMPKGAILVFDELSHRYWPGETVAVLESIGIRELEIQKFPQEPQISFARI